MVLTVEMWSNMYWDMSQTDPRQSIEGADIQPAPLYIDDLLGFDVVNQTLVEFCALYWHLTDFNRKVTLCELT